nr:MAG TPA: hypothetical protein [Caudoviricetes sp.]
MSNYDRLLVRVSMSSRCYFHLFVNCKLIYLLY